MCSIETTGETTRIELENHHKALIVVFLCLISETMRCDLSVL